MTTTGSWIARDACERDDCTMRPYQHRHLADGTPEPAVADCEMSEAIARATTLAHGRGRELAESAYRLSSVDVGDTISAAALSDLQAVLRAVAAPAETDAGNGELARTLRSLHSTLVTQVRDMGAERMEAWLYGVLVGWDCGADCEDPTDPEHACDGAMGELADRFGWSRRDVAELRRLRASVVAHLAATPPAPEGEAGSVREAADLVENVLTGNHASASPGAWGAALRVLRDHARATTPSDGRSRERRSLVLADREAELLEIKGPCSDPECRLHYAHRGPHDDRELSATTPGTESTQAEGAGETAGGER